MTFFFALYKNKNNKSVFWDKTGSIPFSKLSLFYRNLRGIVSTGYGE